MYGILPRRLFRESPEHLRGGIAVAEQSAIGGAAAVENAADVAYDIADLRIIATPNIGDIDLRDINGLLLKT